MHPDLWSDKIFYRGSGNDVQLSANKSKRALGYQGGNENTSCQPYIRQIRSLANGIHCRFIGHGDCRCAPGTIHPSATASWSMCLSRVKSAISCFNRRFSSSNCLSCLSSATPIPANCFRHRKNEVSVTPNLHGHMPVTRQTSTMGTPESASRNADIICSSAKLFLAIEWSFL
jgi:hypothetical protein